MKIVHITTFDVGGAGNAAVLLCRGLIEAGIESKLLCMKKSSTYDFVCEYNTRSKGSFFSRILARMFGKKTKYQKQQSILHSLKGNYQLYAFPDSNIKLLDCKEIKEADIIHLHWISYFIDYDTFFPKVKKPIVWTIHDRNPFLGGFHLETDRQSNPQFRDIEEKIMSNKVRAIQATDNIVVVAPSKFMHEFSKSSRSLGKFEHCLIPNSIDSKVFHFQENLVSKAALGLPLDKKIVLFLNSPAFHKGADIVHDVFEEEEFSNLHIVALGEGYSVRTEHITYLPTISDPVLLAKLYAASDVFLIPSREDNFPNMMLEALACGTPVIGTDIGGIPDVIEPNFNGVVLHPPYVKSMEATLRHLNEGLIDFNRQEISRNLLKNYNSKVQVNAYINVYQSLFDNHLKMDSNHRINE